MTTTKLPTVLITGASSGIGATYAERFARRGHPLVLVARNLARLETLAARLRAESGVTVDVQQADLTQTTDLARIETRLREDACIGILINNAGVAQSGAFLAQTAASIDSLIALNVSAPARLAAAVAPRLAQAGTGAIVNIGSVVGFAPEFGATLYGASKAFVLFLSQGLQVELASSGVYVQAVLPAATRTEIWARSGVDVNTLPEVMEVGELVDAALVGFDRREPVTIPPLHGAEHWDALDGARRALLGDLRQAHATCARHMRPSATGADASRSAGAADAKCFPAPAPQLPFQTLGTDTKSMKALTFQRYGKNPGIGFSERPQPTPKADELLVRVHAAGLNPIDTMIPTGLFKPILSFPLPAILGSDLAGVVTAVGSRVTRFRPGDEIFASLFDQGTGSLAEYATVPEQVAALKPARLDFVQAAAMPMVALTAWQAMVTRAKLQAGQKVFIPAGAGGVGSFAIQLAKHLGATVATTTSTHNIEMLQDLGADEIIDYTRQDFREVLHDYDLVLGTLRGRIIEDALSILRPGGRIISLTGPIDPTFAHERRLNPLIRAVLWLLSRKIVRRAARQRAGYSFLFVRPDGAELAQIARLLQSGQIRPVIDHTFPFAQAPEALNYLATGHAHGKVVISMA